MAMAHSGWTALLNISQHFKAKGPREPASRAVQKETVDRILQELDRLGIPHHPHRRLALMTAVGPCQRQPRDASAPLGIEKYDGSIGRVGPPPSFILYAAAQRGYLKTVVWFCGFSFEYDYTKALTDAAEHGHFEVVSWLLDRVPSTKVDVVVEVRDLEQGVLAWRTGTTKLFTLTQKWGYSLSHFRYDTDALAAKCGDVDGVRWLLAHPRLGPNFDSRVVRAAAAAGQLEVLEFLEQNCRHVFKNAGILSVAVEKSQVSVAQWLVEKALCSANEITDLSLVRAAIRSSNAETLAWVRTAGNKTSSTIPLVEWPAGSLSNADALAWLVREDGFRVTTMNAHSAMSSRDVTSTKWIVAHCVANKRVSEHDGVLLVEAAIALGVTELVLWFVEELSLWSPRAFEIASTKTSVDTLAYVYETAVVRSDAPTIPGSRVTLDLECLDTLEWLLHRGFRTGLFHDRALECLESDEADCLMNQQMLGTSDRDSPYRRCDSQAVMKLRRAATLIIDLYDPEFVRSIKWLPLWAMQHGNLHTLKRLAAIDHPTVFAPSLFQRLIGEYQNEQIVRWFLEQRPLLFSTRVVQWGAKHDMRAFLSWIFQAFLPRYLQDKRDAQLVLRRCTRAAICMASRRSRWSVLREIRQWTPMANDPALWHDVTSRGSDTECFPIASK